MSLWFTCLMCYSWCLFDVVYVSGCVALLLFVLIVCFGWLGVLLLLWLYADGCVNFTRWFVFAGC